MSSVPSLNLFSQQVDTNRPFQFEKRSELVIGTHNETLAIAAMRVRIEIGCPSESTAETQPQLQPALLRLSAMISQDFIAVCLY
jgi:hypothetical protein